MVTTAYIGTRDDEMLSNATDLMLHELSSPQNHARWWAQLEQVAVVVALLGLAVLLLRAARGLCGGDDARESCQ